MTYLQPLYSYIAIERLHQLLINFTVSLKCTKLIPEFLYIAYSALLEPQEIFGLAFDPTELDQLEKEGLESDEEGGKGKVHGRGVGCWHVFYGRVYTHC